MILHIGSSSYYHIMFWYDIYFSKSTYMIFKTDLSNKYRVIMILCLGLFYVPACLAQNEKVKTTGAYSNIIFEKQTTITDSILFHKSMDSFTKKFVESLKDELEKDSTSYNHQDLEFLQMSGIFKKQLFDIYPDQGKTFYHLKKVDSLWLSYKIIDGQIIGDYTVLNFKDMSYYKLAKIDSSSTYNHATLTHKDEKNIDIQEYRKDKKVINNFDCFKVVLQINEEESPIPGFKGETVYEMYVTEDIDLKYHPIIKYKSVVDHYLPLEIRVLTDGIEGVETKYSFDIKN